MESVRIKVNHVPNQVLSKRSKFSNSKNQRSLLDINIIIIIFTPQSCNVKNTLVVYSAYFSFYTISRSAEW